MIIKDTLPMAHRRSWKPCVKRKAVFSFCPNAASSCTSNGYRGPPMTTKAASYGAYVPHAYDFYGEITTKNCRPRGQQFRALR